MAAKKVTGQKLGLGAFHKATGGADEFLPSAPRGGPAEPSLRGSADNWKTDREAFQTRRGGGGGGRGGGFGGGGGGFASRRPPAGDDAEDGGEDAGPTRSDSAAEWRSARPARGGAGGGGFGGGGAGGARQPFVAGQPRGQYAEEGERSSGAWRPRGGARGGAAGGGGSSFGSGFAARRNYDDDGAGAGAGGRSFGSGRGGYSRGGGFAGGAPGGPRRGRDEEDAGADAGPERDFGAWRSGNAQPPARRPIGAGVGAGAGAGAGSSRGGRFGGAEERPAHLRLKDRLKPAPGAAAGGAAADDGEADAAEETPKAAAKPAAKMPAAAAEDGDAEAGAEGEEEDAARAPAPKAAAAKPTAAKPAASPAGRANPFGAARARDEPALAPIKGRGKAAAAPAPAEEDGADEAAAGEGEDQESEPVPAKRPVTAAAAARGKPAARQPEPEPEDDGEGEQQQDGEGEGEGEEDDDDDEDDDGKPKSVWAANISAQKKAAKVAAAKAEAQKKAAAAQAAAAPRSVFRPRAMMQRDAAPVATDEDITPAESARRKAAEEEAAASKRLTANASNARRAVSQLGARPAAAPAPAARAAPAPAPAAAKPKSNPFGAARPVQTKDSDAAPLAPLKRGGRPAAEAPARGRFDLADDEPGAEGEDEDNQGEDEGEGEVEAPRPSAAKVAKPAAGAGAGKGAAAAAAAAAPGRVAGKLSKEIESKKVVSAKDSKSALDLALRDETTVTEQQLVEGLERLSIRKGDADTVQRLADVIAKSVIDGKLSLADAVAAAQQNPTAGPASALIAAVAQIIKKRKGETQLTALVAAAKESEVDVFKAVTADLKQSDAKAVDAFLTERDLLCLKPMDDATDDVVAAIAANKPAKAVLDIIQKKAGNVAVAYLAVPAVEQVAKLLSADAKMSALDTYAPVLERVIRADRAVEVSVLNFLMTVLAKDVIKAVWAKLKDTNAITAEGFLQWQSERPDPKKKLTAEEKNTQAFKQTAIIATSGWLSDVAEEVRKLNEPEPEDGDGEGEGDEGEEDEYLQNSNY